MKTKLLICAVLLSGAISSHGAPPEQLPPAHNKEILPGPYSTKGKQGEHHQIFDSLGIPKDNLSASYTQLETGLNYFEGSRWRKSKEVIELIDGYGVARRCKHIVIFKPNANTVAALEIIPDHGREIMTHVLGLSYFDAASGQSVLLADMKDSQGELIWPNQIVYKDCFRDLKADLRYTYTKAGLEQDLILLEQPPPPEEFGLNPQTTRFEVLTEIFRAPEPRKEAKTLKKEANPSRRQQMAEPDLIDELLEFGVMRMSLNKFFVLDNDKEDEFVLYNSGKGMRAGFYKTGRSGRVAKRWLQMDGRQMLVEAVEYGALQELLATLPAVNGEAVSEKPRQQAATQRVWPHSRQTTPDPAQRSAIQLAQAPYNPRGVVLDFYLMNAANDLTFENGKTYHITGDLHLRGTTVIEKNAILKFAPGASLMIEGKLRCPPSGRAILTAEIDQAVGAAVPVTGFGPVYGRPALALLDPDSSGVIQNLDFRYADAAVSLYSAGGSHIIKDCTFFKCRAAVEVYGAEVHLENPQMQWVQTPARLLGGGARVTQNKPASIGGAQPNSTQRASFRLMNEDDHGNSFATATPISPNSSIDGVINYGQDGDVFSLQIPYGGTLTAYTTGTTDTYGWLYDANAACIVYNDDNPYPNFGFSATVSGGTYYILVKHYSWLGTGPYTLHVEYVTNPPTPVPDPVPVTRPADHGNTIWDAHLLELNSSVDAAIDVAGDEDFFLVYMSSFGTLTAHTTGSTDTYGYILDSNGQIVAQDDDAGQDYNFSTSYTGSSGAYYIRVRHYYSWNTGPYTLHVASSSPAPPAPAWLTGSASVRSVYLYWASVPEASTYVVKRSLTGHPGTFAVCGTTSNASYGDTGLNDGTTYYYTVSSQNWAGVSSDSDVINRTTAPAPPGYIAAYGGLGAIYICWSAPAGASYYRVHRAAAGAGFYVSTASPVFNAWYMDYYVAPGTAYDYMVTGVSMSGAEGLYSPSTRGITAPGSPQGVTATPGAGRINLTWEPAPGASSYNVRRSTVSGGANSIIATGLTTTSYANTGLPSNTTYYYTVTGSNASGEGFYSAEAPATTAPNAPTGVAAVASSGQITLTWNVSAGASSYRVKRSATSGGPYDAIAAVSSTMFVDAPLADGSTWFYVVSAVNSAGTESFHSNQVSGSTPITDSDADGLPDSWEIQFFGNLQQHGHGDFDGDGLTNQQEFTLGTNPALLDTNSNGIADGYEDYDGDGLPNLFERLFGLNMFVFDDLNANGIGDWREDTDNDGLPDALERLIGSSVTVVNGAPSLPSPLDKIPLLQ
jgi:fibronectin type 3 domain-containing protein